MKQIKWDRCSKSQFMYSHLHYFKKLVKDQNISRFCFLFSFQMIKIKISFPEENCAILSLFFSPTEPSRTFVRLVNPQVFHLCSFLILTLFSTLLFTTRFKHIYKWCWDFLYNFFSLLWKIFFVTEIFSCDRAEVTLEAMDWGARCRSGGIYSKWFLKEVESAFFSFLEGNTQ